MKKTDLNKKGSDNLESYSVYDDLLFSKIELSKKTKIVESEFEDCVFKNCKFFEVQFFNCRFENCTFDNCDLASVSIKHSSFRDVTCIDSKLTGIQWADASIPLDLAFHNCLLNYSSFIGVDLRKTELLRCQLKEVDFTEANLSKANLQYSDLTGARFINTNLEYTDLTNAINYSIHPDGNKLRKTKFSLPDALSLLDVYDIIIS